MSGLRDEVAQARERANQPLPRDTRPAQRACASLAHYYATDIPKLADALDVIYAAVERRHRQHCGACYEDASIGARKQPCEIADLLRRWEGEANGKP
jgi:hypothetical protein